MSDESGGHNDVDDFVSCKANDTHTHVSIVSIDIVHYIVTHCD